MERKQQIRAVLKEKRNHLSEQKIIDYSGRICEILSELPFWEESSILYFYYPLGKEVNLLSLAQQVLEQGKTVAFPKTDGTHMDFYQVSALSAFQKGAFGIMEPVEKKPLLEKKPLVLVPGVGFDYNGRRIGYGKGFYDRYFQRFLECTRIGIAYDCQIMEELPADDYDVPMEMVVTEKQKYIQEVSG